MAGNVRGMLAREAAEAEAVAEAEDRGERAPAPGQRARRQAGDPSQVYSIRIPVDRLEQLRALAEQRGVPPTALMRELVLQGLDQVAAGPAPAAVLDREQVERASDLIVELQAVIGIQKQGRRSKAAGGAGRSAISGRMVKTSTVKKQPKTTIVERVAKTPPQSELERF